MTLRFAYISHDAYICRSKVPPEIRSDASILAYICHLLQILVAVMLLLTDLLVHRERGTTLQARR